MFPPSLSMTVAAPSGPGITCRLWSGYVCRRPRELLDSYNAAAAIVDAPHRVQKEDEESPQGNELEAPLAELIVSGRRQMAARAHCCRTFARSHDYFNTLLVGTETGVLIDKTSETMAAVQDRGQFHGGETSTIDRPHTQVHDW
jgi:hypothetical protein